MQRPTSIMWMILRSGLVSLYLFLAACSSLDIGNHPYEPGKAGPIGPEEGPMRRQRWLLPSPEQAVMIHATVWRPNGAGPSRWL